MNGLGHEESVEMGKELLCASLLTQIERDYLAGRVNVLATYVALQMTCDWLWIAHDWQTPDELNADTIGDLVTVMWTGIMRSRDRLGEHIAGLLAARATSLVQADNKHVTRVVDDFQALTHELLGVDEATVMRIAYTMVTADDPGRYAKDMFHTPLRI